jgi:bifunctional ADP-heptose synthase (sugar kinase/adenylyltransferase)
MLSDLLIEQILAALPTRKVGLIGDLFLDRYLDIDHRLTEPSIETGLDAYQVTRVRCYPGALGTVINNLVALGVGTILPVTAIGTDGEGFELIQALQEMPSVEIDGILLDKMIRTPTYTKPMLEVPGEPPRELNRIDIKNRSRLPENLESQLLRTLEKTWKEADAWIVLDQVSEKDCGVITQKVRERIAQLASQDPKRFVLADSRELIHEFRSVSVKPNQREGETFPGGPSAFARATGRPVFLTRGEQGIDLISAEGEVKSIPAYAVNGPIDIVGAGDSTSAGIVSGIVAGTTYEQAAAFGNLVASITIQQIGTTGTASPEQLKTRWKQVSGS